MWPVEGLWIFDEERVLVELVTAEITVTQPREIVQYEEAQAPEHRVVPVDERARPGLDEISAIGAAIAHGSSQPSG